MIVVLCLLMGLSTSSFAQFSSNANEQVIGSKSAAVSPAYSYKKIAARAQLASTLSDKHLATILPKHLSLCQSAEEARIYLTALGYAKGYGLSGLTISRPELTAAMVSSELVNRAFTETAAGHFSGTDEAMIAISQIDVGIGTNINDEVLDVLVTEVVDYNMEDLLAIYIDPAMGIGAQIDEQMAHMDAMIANYMAIIQSSMNHAGGFDWGDAGAETAAGAVIGAVGGAAAGAVAGSAVGGVGAVPGAAAGAQAGFVGGAVTGFLNYCWGALKGDGKKDKKSGEEESDEEGDDASSGGDGEECFPPIILEEIGIALNQDQSDFIYMMQLDYLNVLETLLGVNDSYAPSTLQIEFFQKYSTQQVHQY